jgi:hypothetical protein
MSITSDLPAAATFSCPEPVRGVPPPPGGAARLKEPLSVLLFTLGLGWSADLLFQGGDAGLGINVPIFLLLFVAVLSFIGYREGAAPKRNAVALFLLPALFFGGMIAVRASATLPVYDLVACAVLLLLYVRFYSGGNPFALSLGECLGGPWESLGRVIAAPFAQRIAFDSLAPSQEQRAGNAAVGRGVLLALPIVVVFTALLANADGMFASVLNHVAQWIVPADIGDRAWRTAGVIGVAFLCLGAIAYAITRREEEVTAATARPHHTVLGSIESTVILGSLLALFTAFLLTQAGYLFGGDARIRAVSDLTYATYARHGFAELNVVAVLVLCLVSGLKRFTKRENVSEEARFAGLATALVGLTLPLLASSVARMQAYEAAYGATELRLYVDLFIVWLAVGLLWFAATLWQRRVAGGLGVYVCAVGFLVSLNLIDPDAAIVRQNADRYAATGRLDTEYIGSLSDDALPEVVRLRAMVARRAGDTTALDKLLQESGENDSHSAWGSWNLARVRAGQLRAAYRITEP